MITEDMSLYVFKVTPKLMTRKMYFQKVKKSIIILLSFLKSITFAMFSDKHALLFFYSVILWLDTEML